MATVLPLEKQSPAAAHTTTVQMLACSPAAWNAVTLLLALPGTRRAPAPYLPGQFITLAVPTAQRTMYRSYSLCGDGRADAPWEITVKRQDKGLISTYLCQRARPGMLLRTSLPQGGFTLPGTMRPGAPLVFIAGGSGITPIYGMLRARAPGFGPAPAGLAALRLSQSGGCHLRPGAGGARSAATMAHPAAIRVDRRRPAAGGAGIGFPGRRGAERRVVRLRARRAEALAGGGGSAPGSARRAPPRRGLREPPPSPRR